MILSLVASGAGCSSSESSAGNSGDAGGSDKTDAGGSGDAGGSDKTDAGGSGDAGGSDKTDAGGSGDPGGSDKIAALESGLLPAFVARGTSPTPKSLTDRMKRYNTPGVSIAVISSGKLAWARGYGLRDTQTGEAVTPETLFQACSISKSVAATGVMSLVQDGKIDLDKDVNQYLKDWKVPENQFTVTEKVTTRRLLAHTAGINVDGFDGYPVGSPYPTVSQILRGEAPANTPALTVENEPGKAFSYSGGGYTILQALVQDVSGKSLADYVHEHVLVPSGMTASGFFQPLPQDLSAKAASGHKGDASVVPGKWHVYPEHAAAGLWSTPSDLARYMIGMIQSHTDDKGPVLSRATVQTMFTRQIEAVSGTFYGLGVLLRGQGQDLLVSHTAGNEGFKGLYMYSPQRQEGVVVLTNSDTGDEIYQEVSRGIAKIFGWPALSPTEIDVAALTVQQLDAYVGSYSADISGKGNTKFLVKREGNELVGQLSVLGTASYSLYTLPSDKLLFGYSSSPLTFVAVRDDQGKVTGLEAQAEGYLFKRDS